MVVLYVALGGALGAAARYGLGGWIHSWAGAEFPWGTFVINALGSLLIGFLLRFLEGAAVTPELRALVTVGGLGGFTTFSTFSYETAMLLHNGEWGRAALYALGSLVLGLLAVFCGFYLAALALQPRG